MNPTPRLKTTRVFIENQPEQCMIYAGRSSFGASPYAYTDSEEKATHIVRAVNSFELMKRALEEIEPFLAERGIGGNMSIIALRDMARAALAAAD